MMDTPALLATCRARDIGVMAIKAITRAPWGDRPRAQSCWYEPFESPADIQAAWVTAPPREGALGCERRELPKRGMDTPWVASTPSQLAL